MKLRIIARTIILDDVGNKILLVKNRGANFWYAPGGGWEYERESIIECAQREVKEETGLDVSIKRFLYSQEFHESKDVIHLEIFWLAKCIDQGLDSSHVDLDTNGKVEEACWFGKEELENLTVFPKRLKDAFWKVKEELLQSEDLFLGVQYDNK